MLVVESGVLQFQVLEFFVLVGAIALEQIGQVVDALADLLMQFLELGLRAFLQLLQLHLQFALLLPLRLQGLLEVVHGHLNWEECTSMSSTCSFTVVVRPSLESVRPARDIIKSLRLALVRICNKIISQVQSVRL